MVEDLEPIAIEVQALDNYKLYIKFNNGEEKIYDMKPLLNHKFYQGDGTSIEWETGEDIAPENLYNDSIPIKE